METSKQERLHIIQEQIRAAALRAGRDPADVKLLAVSKTKSWEEVRDFALLGQVDFGENYVQEALAKTEALEAWASSQRPKPLLRWHFIGNLQSNKAKFIPGNFSLFHALDSVSLAQKIAKSAEARGLVQPSLVEVNVDGEKSKGGISPLELRAFLEQCQGLSSLEIRGLMCIPAPRPIGNRREPFALLRELMQKVNASGCYRALLSELSMGMSNDFEDAVLEGSTMVRIGTSLFGERKKDA